MRSYDEVLGSLRRFAGGREDVLAMWLAGSRADSSRRPDELSDYDVGILSVRREAFAEDESWLEPFGPILVRWPLEPAPTTDDGSITQLVLFDDGVRIDFQITDGELDLAAVRLDGYRVLVDKGGLFPEGDHEPDYRLAPPGPDEFARAMNAFFWDIIYVPKALCRGELNYAKFMIDGSLRFGFLKSLIEWYIGVTVGWKVNPGIYGRWFERYLPPELWGRYLETFSSPDAADGWRALFETLEFVRTLGREVADRLALDYPVATDRKVSGYIDHLYRDLARGG